MYLSIGTYFIECKKCDRIIVFCVYYHFLIGVLCTQYFQWTLVGGNEGSCLMGLVLRFWNKSRNKKHDTRPTCIYTYSMYPCVLYLRNIWGPPTIGPSDHRALGLSTPRIIGRSVGTLGLMGGHRWILCTNHCFPRGRTAGKLNFPVYLNITFIYSLRCDFSCLSWKSSKKIIWSRSMTKPTKWPVRPDKTQINLGIHSVWSVFTVRMKKPWVLSYPLNAQWRLIRLCRCAGWFESSMGAHAIILVLSWIGSLFTKFC